jgi:hypothetical protein
MEEPRGQTHWLFVEPGFFDGIQSMAAEVDDDFCVVCRMDGVPIGEDIFCELMDDDHFVRQSILG